MNAAFPNRRRRCDPAAAPQRAWGRRSAWPAGPCSPRRRTPRSGSPARPAAGGHVLAGRARALSHHADETLPPRDPPAQGARVVHPDRLARILEAVLTLPTIVGPPPSSSAPCPTPTVRAASAVDSGGRAGRQPRRRGRPPTLTPEGPCGPTGARGSWMPPLTRRRAPCAVPEAGGSRAGAPSAPKSGAASFANRARAVADPRAGHGAGGARLLPTRVAEVVSAQPMVWWLSTMSVLVLARGSGAMSAVVDVLTWAHRGTLRDPGGVGSARGAHPTVTSAAVEVPLPGDRHAGHGVRGEGEHGEARTRSQTTMREAQHGREP
jgi:hypothetical protein